MPRSASRAKGRALPRSRTGSFAAQRKASQRKTPLALLARVAAPVHAFRVAAPEYTFKITDGGLSKELADFSAVVARLTVGLLPVLARHVAKQVAFVAAPVGRRRMPRACAELEGGGELRLCPSPELEDVTLRLRVLEGDIEALLERHGVKNRRRGKARR